MRGRTPLCPAGTRRLGPGRRRRRMPGGWHAAACPGRRRAVLGHHAGSREERRGEHPPRRRGGDRAFMVPPAPASQWRGRHERHAVRCATGRRAVRVGLAGFSLARRRGGPGGEGHRAAGRDEAGRREDRVRRGRRRRAALGDRHAPNATRFLLVPDGYCEATILRAQTDAVIAAYFASVQVRP